MSIENPVSYGKCGVLFGFYTRHSEPSWHGLK